MPSIWFDNMTILNVKTKKSVLNSGYIVGADSHCINVSTQPPYWSGLLAPLNTYKYIVWRGLLALTVPITLQSVCFPADLVVTKYYTFMFELGLDRILCWSKVIVSAQKYLFNAKKQYANITTINLINNFVIILEVFSYFTVYGYYDD